MAQTADPDLEAWLRALAAPAAKEADELELVDEDIEEDVEEPEEEEEDFQTNGLSHEQRNIV